MKAIQVCRFGGPEVLELMENLPPLEYTSQEVIVEVKACGVNPSDVYKRTGMYNPSPKLPYIPGSDAAGIISKVGSAVSNSKLKIGDRVFTRPPLVGAYASHVAVPSSQIYKLPDRLSFAQGAAIGVPYFTAYRALFTKGMAKPTDRILIHGASGAVGIACCQIGQAKNLNIIGTAGSDDGMALIKHHGAKETYNHRTGNYQEQIIENGGVDLIVENLANVNLANDCKMLRNDGRIMIVGSRGSLEFDPRLTMAKEISIQGVFLMRSTENDWKESGNALTSMMEAGFINPEIQQIYDLKDAPQAHSDVINPDIRAAGKLVLSIE